MEWSSRQPMQQSLEATGGSGRGSAAGGKQSRSMFGGGLPASKKSLKQQEVAAGTSAPSERRKLRGSGGQATHGEPQSQQSQSPLPASASVGIIGGGLAGLACGWALRKRGVPAVVYDTGKKGPGGRASSRQLVAEDSSRHVVDHAVQAFTATSPDVMELVQAMEQGGAVKPWRGKIGSMTARGVFREREASEGDLWIGSAERGMGEMSAWLAKGLDIRQDVWVARLQRDGEGCWDLLDQKRRNISRSAHSYVVMAHNGKCADRLIKTVRERTAVHAPLRCAFKAQASPSNDRLELSSLWVCIVLLPAGLAPCEGAFIEDHEVLSWAGNNTAKYTGKGGKKGKEAWTLISTPTYGSANKCSQEFIPDLVRKRVSEQMCQAFADLIGVKRHSDWEVLHLQLWGAALPLNVCSQMYIHDHEAGIGVCGDWLVAPSVEGALQSGLALAEAIDRDLRDASVVTTAVQRFYAVQGGRAIGSFGEVSASSPPNPGDSVDGEAVWNFAFGANINPWKLKERRNIHPLEEVGGALPGWRLVFNHSGGMGNVEPVERDSKTPDVPAAVHGKLLRLSRRDFDKLANMEYEYTTTEVEVQAYDGRIIKAVAFTTPPEFRLGFYPSPPERYINLIRNGAKSSKLDSAYQDWLRNIEGVSQQAQSIGSTLVCLAEVKRGPSSNAGKVGQEETAHDRSQTDLSAVGLKSSSKAAVSHQNWLADSL
eukprot:CAMPEP_0178381418 /NCGR_PEP_ID=MMETSP0689_2-20121128/5972_1 /TAXON_ID=160604 /ORGANISM="Amphidinium massartii, Strain CS-259" /LENGTH=710 /DNA_ID=CAMNT_0020001599 /DNA_START=52 /DNA_END=2185 /DNA_ORIENTATION=+